ncbi:phenylacetate--CoA ligase family protein [Planotetraspora sp. GP83]|uniref:phenylacetate--CoA ligase family protein n=1 Tax=Planotetraspora sp. GP83 TaxID=3156264 RepID=UPI0035192077
MQRELSSQIGELLAYVRENVPYYAGIPIPSTEADLSGLPILERADIQRAGRSLQSLSGDPDGWLATSTSGTTGEPLTVFFDSPPQALEIRLIRRLAERLGIGGSPGILHLTLHAPGPSRAMVSPWGDGNVLTRWNLARLWQLDDRAFAERLERAVAGRILTAKPSVFGLLADRLGDRGTSAPGVVLMSGETCPPDLRRKIEERFHCPVSSLYTMAEVGIVATECPAAAYAYHCEQESCHIEILDGDVLVTPLTNRAMPLIRYRSGDRARWLEGGCRCDRAAPVFELTSARSPRHLLTADGGLVSIGTFMKAMISLPVDRISLAQQGAGQVRIDYQARTPLTESDRERAAAPLRSALGLGTRVSFHRHEAAAFPLADGRPVHPAGTAVPLGPSLEDLSSWLESWCAEHSLTPQAVILTGSVLEPVFRTRFSDVDLTLVTDDPPEAWTGPVRLIRRHLPALRVMITSERDSVARSPLATCRLICEGTPLLGSLPAFAWPASRALATEGVHWCQTAADTLWHQFTDPDTATADTLATAYLAHKVIVNACRYRHVVFEDRQTRAASVLAAELDPAESPATEAIEVACEHRPPPPECAASLRYLTAARAIALTVAAELGDYLTGTNAEDFP